jgi:hypothetical protein
MSASAGPDASAEPAIVAPRRSSARAKRGGLKQQPRGLTDRGGGHGELRSRHPFHSGYPQLTIVLRVASFLG